MQKLAENPIKASNQADFLPLNGTDYVEFYVGNAKQAAYYYRAAFGMRWVAYRGPETGTRDASPSSPTGGATKHAGLIHWFLP